MSLSSSSSFLTNGQTVQYTQPPPPSSRGLGVSDRRYDSDITTTGEITIVKATDSTSVSVFMRNGATSKSNIYGNGGMPEVHAMQKKDLLLSKRSNRIGDVHGRSRDGRQPVFTALNGLEYASADPEDIAADLRFEGLNETEVDPTSKSAFDSGITAHQGGVHTVWRETKKATYTGDPLKLCVPDPKEQPLKREGRNPAKYTAYLEPVNLREHDVEDALYRVVEKALGDAAVHESPVFDNLGPDSLFGDRTFEEPNGNNQRVVYAARALRADTLATAMKAIEVLQTRGFLTINTPQETAARRAAEAALAALADLRSPADLASSGDLINLTLEVNKAKPAELFAEFEKLRKLTDEYVAALADAHFNRNVADVAVSLFKKVLGAEFVAIAVDDFNIDFTADGRAGFYAAAYSVLYTMLLTKDSTGPIAAPDPHVRTDAKDPTELAPGYWYNYADLKQGEHWLDEREHFDAAINVGASLQEKAKQQVQNNAKAVRWLARTLGLIEGAHDGMRAGDLYEGQAEDTRRIQLDLIKARFRTIASDVSNDNDTYALTTEGANDRQTIIETRKYNKNTADVPTYLLTAALECHESLDQRIVATAVKSHPTAPLMDVHFGFYRHS